MPSFTELKLPQELAHVADLKNGIVLVTGPTGSGKSSTLAAILDRINETKAYHILTIEDPKILWSSRIATNVPSFTSGSCIVTLRALPWHCGLPCGRPPR
jgi:Tfp pilus assembly pilus retraction ATPase PilT